MAFFNAPGRREVVEVHHMDPTPVDNQPAFKALKQEASENRAEVKSLKEERQYAMALLQTVSDRLDEHINQTGQYIASLIADNRELFAKVKALEGMLSTPTVTPEPAEPVLEEHPVVSYLNMVGDLNNVG